MQQLYKFSFLHDDRQDRIQMLAEGADGFRCGWWLTRRLTRNLLVNSQAWLTEQYAAQMNVPVSSQGELYDHYHSQAKDQYEQQQMMQRQVPVAEIDQTPLLERIDVSIEGEDLRLTFFSTQDPDGFALLSVSYFHQLLHVLQSKTEQMEWDITTPVVQSEYALQ